jgi:streptomycin 6-kinase
MIAPRDLAGNIEQLFGEKGSEWLSRLPAAIADCERRWSIRVGPPFQPLSYNYVAPCVLADGTDAVLKLGVPDLDLMTEIEALKLYHGRGCVRLLEAAPDLCALLLDRIRPGTPLLRIDDNGEATSIAAGVIRGLARPVPECHTFPTVARWARGLERLRERFDGGTGPLPAPLVGQAEVLFGELISSMGKPVLLHGDLHHENILQAERSPWLAVDPKGVIGEREYEVGCLLRNPVSRILEMGDLVELSSRRIAQLADELVFDRARIRGWALAQAVLAAWWCIEDNGDCQREFIACAEALASVRV